MEPIDTPEQDELTVLKARADMMGITYHPSIGVDKLRAKVQAKLDGTEAPEEPVVTKKEEEVGTSTKTKETVAEKRLRLQQEATKLVRINVTCMNPQKKEWDGEFITTGNNIVGTHTKFVPFNTSEGWHVPNIIYQQLKERKFQTFYTVKDNRGNDIRKGKLVNEFAIEVLPQLTQAELAELARKQAMAKSRADD